jgi:hypothetical protein
VQEMAEGAVEGLAFAGLVGGVGLLHGCPLLGCVACGLFP